MHDPTFAVYYIINLVYSVLSIFHVSYCMFNMFYLTSIYVFLFAY